MDNKHGLTTQLSYTWSHEIDIGQNDLAGLNAPYNAKFDKGSDAGLDRRHIFNASYVYSLPFFQKSGNLAAREIIGGWSISGITALETGSANNVSGTLTGADTVGLGAGSNRPDLISPVVYLNPKASVNGTRPLLLQGLLCHAGKQPGAASAQPADTARPERIRSEVQGSNTSTSLCSRSFRLHRVKERSLNFDSSRSIPSTTPTSHPLTPPPLTETSAP